MQASIISVVEHTTHSTRSKVIALLPVDSRTYIPSIYTTTKTCDQYHRQGPEQQLCNLQNHFKHNFFLTGWLEDHTADMALSAKMPSTLHAD